ncbi:unnamed protein product [Ilex paraguariensis]|uniref:Uncharacterized protein n=1 Tax=Ilex paraguariensis TaxID=185542 RepID=A0ABC8T046_9AQUA
MALITGRIETLNSSSLSSSICHHSHTSSSPASFSQDPPPHDQPQPPNFHDSKGEVDDSVTPLKHETVEGFSRGNAFEFGSRGKQIDTNTEAIRAPAVEFRERVELSSVAARVPNASDYTELLSKACGRYLNFFTLKDINSCIVASENTRVFCSIIIAVLVVLSHTNLPRNIVKSKSIIASKPLYVLLLTDLTIVLAQLTLEKRRDSEKDKEEKETVSQKDGHNWRGAIKILEVGLVLHQTMRAILIDCSFYVVIVICGLSLV